MVDKIKTLLIELSSIETQLFPPRVRFQAVF